MCLLTFLFVANKGPKYKIIHITNNQSSAYTLDETKSGHGANAIAPVLLDYKEE